MGDGRRDAGRRARHAAGDQHAEPTTPTDLTVRFDAVVGQLADDRAWRRRVRSVRRRHRATWLGSWALHCFAEVGCWFTGVPAQRCTARPIVRPAGDG